MPTFLEDRNSVRQSIGRSGGYMLGRKTYAATAGSLSFGRFADLLLRNAEFGEGLHMYIATGGGAGQARTVVSTAAFIQGTGSIVYPHLNFTTAPSTNSNFEFWRGIEAPDVNGFIDDAIRNAARHFLQHKEDYSIQLGDPLRHWGSFERWPDGAAAAPDGWTLSTNDAESVARESAIVYSGRYSAALTNAAANAAYLESDNIKGFPQFAGEVVSIKAQVWSTVVNRVRVQLLDGNATFSGTYHDGAGGWEESLIDNVTINPDMSQLKVRLTIESGDATTAYFGKVWMEHNGQVYDFELPADIDPATSDETAFASISEIYAESTSTPGEFNTRIPNEFWNVDSDSTVRRIVFTRGLIDQYVTPGRGIKIVGQRPARLPTADTQNLEVDPEYVRRHAMYSILDSMPWDDMDRSKRDRWERLAAEKLATITTSYYPDSVLVEL